MKYMVDPIKFIVNAVAALFLLFFTVIALLEKSWILFAVFLASFSGFLFMAIGYGASIEIGKDSLTRRYPIPFFPRTKLKRNEVAEVGVMGTSPFYKGEKWRKSRTGTIYLYFSKEKLTNNDRRELCLRWKPQIIRLRYSKDRAFQVQVFWDSELKKYHIGKLEL